MNTKVTVCLIFLLVLLAGGVIMAAQPYENDFEAIPQDLSQCGPTSFYMIFNHYGDHDLYTRADLTTELDFTAVLEKVTADTEICQYINGGSVWGTSWQQLKDAADGIYKDGEQFYSSELNDGFTAYKNAAAEAERKSRLLYIHENYLENNLPVIIHLRRTWPLSGHYIVLTGYDEDQQVVYFADPIQAISGTVDKEAFIKDKWYVSPTYGANYYRARWDGEWMGFYR